MTDIPLYSLYQGEELQHIQSHIHKIKPSSQFIEAAWRVFQKSQSTSQCHSEKNLVLIALEEILFKEKSKEQDVFLDILEQWLQTTIYLGLNQSFCLFILTEMMHFAALYKRTDLFLYEFSPFGRVTWKAFLRHPFIHRCLHEDARLKLYGFSKQREQRGRFFIQTTSCMLATEDIQNAIEAKNLRFLKILVPSPTSPDLCYLAASNDAFDILIWLRSQQCAWDVRTASTAALNDHLNVLKWAMQQGCPWDQTIFSFAASRGDLETLIYLREQTKQDFGARLCSVAAAEEGHVHILEWLVEQGHTILDFELICGKASSFGHLDILKWVKKQGISIPSSTYRSATIHGHFEILQWLRREGVPFDELVCDLAAQNRHFEILKWARSEGAPWDSEVFASAVGSGDMSILTWLKDQGCPWDTNACSYAVKANQFEVLKWLREQGCPEREWLPLG